MKDKRHSETLRDELHAARQKLAARSKTLMDARGRIVEILRTVGHSDPESPSKEMSGSSKTVLERYRHLLSQSERLREEIEDLIEWSRRVRSESMEPFKRSPSGGGGPTNSGKSDPNSTNPFHDLFL